MDLIDHTRLSHNYGYASTVCALGSRNTLDYPSSGRRSWTCVSSREKIAVVGWRRAWYVSCQWRAEIGSMRSWSGWNPGCCSWMLLSRTNVKWRKTTETKTSVTAGIKVTSWWLLQTLGLPFLNEGPVSDSLQDNGIRSFFPLWRSKKESAFINSIHPIWKELNGFHQDRPVLPNSTCLTTPNFVERSSEITTDSLLLSYEQIH